MSATTDTILDRPVARARGTPEPGRWGGNTFTFLGVFAFLIVIAQATLVVQARPQDLITGVHGMADILSRAVPPDISALPNLMWPALETVDIGLFGTVAGVLLALPLAILAARNTSPGAPLYAVSSALIAFCRAVPDLVWALIFVTAVGLGPFPGALAVSVHSIGMLGRLFCRGDRGHGYGADGGADDDRGEPDCRCSATRWCRACCLRCSASRSIGSTRISAHRWCLASSAPAASASSC